MNFDDHIPGARHDVTFRDCPRCKGTGITVSEGFTSLEGKVYPREERQCYACGGMKEYPAPVLNAYLPLIVNPKSGKLYSTSLHSKAGRARFAASRPPVETPEEKASDDMVRRRAQYIWRMALFNSGMDKRGFNLGGAIMADMDLCGDPWKPELDALADQVADQCYGKGANLRAARRWNQALKGY